MCGIWGITSYQPISNATEDIVNRIAASDSIQPRGPERTTIKQTLHYSLTFHRLAINGLSPEHDQPYMYENNTTKYIVLCNGEIYNQTELEDLFELPHYNCDTEVIYPVFKALNYDFVELNKALKGEYALVIITCKEVNGVENPIKLQASVDPCSVRPLFYSIDKGQHAFLFSSLLAGIAKMNAQATRLHGGQCLTYNFSFGSLQVKDYIDYHPLLFPNPIDNYHIKSTIVKTLKACVRRRLTSDRPIGCFLSGGLDSSLIAALVSRELKQRGQRLHTFSIGAEDSEDCRNAQIVAMHIDSIHTHVPFNSHIAISYIQEVIKATETFDLTTIRASMGQYLISKYIKENTDIKVVFSGDGADEEQMGYLYFYNAPTDLEANEESRKLLQEIHLYDGLRVDRCVSVHGLEARVPYLDWDFVDLWLSIPAYLKRPKIYKDGSKKCEKWLIRSAFLSNDPHILPQQVLNRTKETFSDSLSTSKSSWYSVLQAHIKQQTSTCAFQSLMESMLVGCKHCFPETDEAKYYRTLFNLFFGKQNATVIPHMWMPQWSKTKDPSARTLEVYSQANH
jgi:asparagine synthase (glutamine-hydrolysing)